MSGRFISHQVSHTTGAQGCNTYEELFHRLRESACVKGSVEDPKLRRGRPSSQLTNTQPAKRRRFGVDCIRGVVSDCSVLELIATDPPIVRFQFTPGIHREKITSKDVLVASLTPFFGGCSQSKSSGSDGSFTSNDFQEVHQSLAHGAVKGEKSSLRLERSTPAFQHSNAVAVALSRYHEEVDKQFPINKATSGKQKKISRLFRESCMMGADDLHQLEKTLKKCLDHIQSRPLVEQEGLVDLWDATEELLSAIRARRMPTITKQSADAQPASFEESGNSRVDSPSSDVFRTIEKRKVCLAKALRDIYREMHRTFRSRVRIHFPAHEPRDPLGISIFRETAEFSDSDFTALKAQLLNGLNYIDLRSPSVKRSLNALREVTSGLFLLVSLFDLLKVDSVEVMVSQLIEFFGDGTPAVSERLTSSLREAALQSERSLDDGTCADQTVISFAEKLSDLIDSRNEGFTEVLGDKKLSLEEVISSALKEQLKQFSRKFYAEE